METLKTKARQYELTILYKGPPTIVADFQGKAYLFPFGNSGMATAGCGDVLAGIISSLAAQGVALPTPLWWAPFYAEAGNIAAREFGEDGMIARDVADAIPYAIKNLLRAQIL